MNGFLNQFGGTVIQERATERGWLVSISRKKSCSEYCTVLNKLFWWSALVSRWRRRFTCRCSSPIDLSTMKCNGHVQEQPVPWQKSHKQERQGLIVTSRCGAEAIAAFLWSSRKARWKFAFISSFVVQIFPSSGSVKRPGQSTMGTFSDHSWYSIWTKMNI